MVRTASVILATCALFLAPVGVGIAQQSPSLSTAPGPAELPPRSFQGRQYVDSRGCIFIRAGVGGATRWVPRVRRDRSVICGAQPSLPRAAQAATPQNAPVPRPAPTPRATASATVTAAPAASAPPTAAPATIQSTEPVIARAPAAAAPREITVAPEPQRRATATAPARPAPRQTAAPQRKVAAPTTQQPRVASTTRVQRATAPVFNEVPGQRLPAVCAGAERLADGQLSASSACRDALQAAGFNLPGVQPTPRPARAAPQRTATRAPAAAPQRRSAPRVQTTRRAPARGTVVVRQACANGTGTCNRRATFTSVRRSH